MSSSIDDDTAYSLSDLTGLSRNLQAGERAPVLQAKRRIEGVFTPSEKGSPNPDAIVSCFLSDIFQQVECSAMIEEVGLLANFPEILFYNKIYFQSR